MKHSAKGNIILMLAAMIWGCGLVAQKAGMNYMGPLGFTSVRCLMGGIVLLPLVWFMDRRKTEDERKPEASRAQIVKGAIFCGAALTTLILCQQFGLPHTTVGKAGFITALNILITPIIGLFLGKKAGYNLWIGVFIGIFGIYLLCLSGGISDITFGDAMMLGAALVCAIHIHLIDHFVETVDPVKLSSYQFLFTGIVCFVPALIFEGLTWNAIVDCIIPLLYSGIASAGIGYTLQVIGQKMTSPNLACLIMSLETVFSLLAGWLFFHEILEPHEYVGCILMFAAIIISQLPEKEKAAD
ncbi:MAG: DMT family transporter [Bacillota bacterium]|nr:DMT family transporter [Bacillota bacterium]